MNHVKEKHEGAECYCGICDDRTENNSRLGLHIQVGHWVKIQWIRLEKGSSAENVNLELKCPTDL